MQLKRIASGFFFVIVSVFFGFLLGGFLGGTVFSGGGMGWDRLADTLGGMMLGVLITLIGSLVLVRRLDSRKRLVIGIALLVASGLVVLVMWAVQSASRQGEGVETSLQVKHARTGESTPGGRLQRGEVIGAAELTYLP
jgi:hypothetical protein